MTSDDLIAAAALSVGILSLLLASVVRSQALSKILFWIAVALVMDGLSILYVYGAPLPH